MTRKVIKPDRIELKRLPDLMACRGRFTSDPGKVMLAELIEVPGKLSKTGKKKYFLGMIANSKTEQALTALDRGYQSKEFKLEMTCTSLCHIGIEKQAVPYNDTKFSHDTHVLKKNLKCMDCHTPRESHGKTFFKNCKDCHHGKQIKKVKCEDCHVWVKRMVQGKGGIGVKEKPSSNLGVVECIDCYRGVLAKKKDSLDDIKKRCIECHDQSYGDKLMQWKKNSDGGVTKLTPKIEKVREEIRRTEVRGGHTFVYRKPFGEAE